MTPLLSAAIENGIAVTVVTRPAEDYTGDGKNTTEDNIERLRSLGITVRTKSGFHQKFTVIDAKTVWFGSVNFLSFGTAEESLMRFESYDIAGELMDTVLE